jgi:hypothetical protein
VKELHNSYSSPNIIRQIKSMKMRWTEHVARMGKDRKNPEGKKPHGRKRHRWEDRMRMDLRETGCVGVEWI